jgi:hypothetical protein
VIDRARLAAALLAALLLAAPPAGADDPKPAEPKPADAKPAEGEKKAPEPPKPEDVKAYVKEFTETVRKMTDEDAIARVEQLRAWYANAGTADESRKEILGAMKTVADVRGKEALLEAACKALGDFGDKGVGLLRYIVDRGLGQKVPPQGIVRAGIASMGKIASLAPADVKFLTDLLKKEDEFIGDAARALSGYDKAPGALRRDIVEELVKMSEGVFSKQNGSDQPAKRKWNIWGSEVVEAMQKVSHASKPKNPEEFRKWLNDKGEGGGKNPKTWMDPPPEKGK